MGRALWPNTMPSTCSDSSYSRTWPASTTAGSANTNQSTFSEQGGVVREPVDRNTRLRMHGLKIKHSLWDRNLHLLAQSTGWCNYCANFILYRADSGFQHLTFPPSQAFPVPIVCTTTSEDLATVITTRAIKLSRENLCHNHHPPL